MTARRGGASRWSAAATTPSRRGSHNSGSSRGVTARFVGKRAQDGGAKILEQSARVYGAIRERPRVVRVGEQQRERRCDTTHTRAVGYPAVVLLARERDGGGAGEKERARTRRAEEPTPTPAGIAMAELGKSRCWAWYKPIENHTAGMRLACAETGRG